MATPEAIEIRKPLRLAELLAAAIRIYGQRPWAFVGIGLIQAGALLLTVVLPFGLDLAVLAVAFAISFAAVVRLVIGDRIGDALLRTAVAFPVVLVLALVVGVPFTLGSSWLLLWIFAVIWLGLTAFALPAAMAEERPWNGWVDRLTFSLRRTATLARVEFMHAVGVSAALFLINVLVGVVVAIALRSFADNGQLAAVAITQAVLSPYFFIGLTVLYFEQQARAAESVGKPGRQRP